MPENVWQKQLHIDLQDQGQIPSSTQMKHFLLVIFLRNKSRPVTMTLVASSIADAVMRMFAENPTMAAEITKLEVYP